MTRDEPARPACILLTSDPAVARRVADQGVQLIVAAEASAALDAACANPDMPVVVDLQAFPGWPKELRRTTLAGERPGAVVGFSSPLSTDDAVATAEAFCDALVPRPLVLRDVMSAVAPPSY